MWKGEKETRTEEGDLTTPPWRDPMTILYILSVYSVTEEYPVHLSAVCVLPYSGVRTPTGERVFLAPRVVCLGVF